MEHRRSGRGWRGALEALLVMAGFVAFGLGWAALERRAYAHELMPASFLRATETETETQTSPGPEVCVWLVDGYNVLCTTLQGGEERVSWWNEAQRERLLELAAGFGARQAEGGELWVVFDGERDPGERRRGALWQVFAPSADEWLVRRVREAPEPGRIAVVTADRRVAGRVAHCGARIVAPRDFVAACAP